MAAETYQAKKKFFMNNIAARMVYDNAKKALYRAFGNNPSLNIEQFKMTQSFIRLEQLAVVGQTNYTFPVQVNQGTAFNTEQRLNLQDSFVISSIGAFIALPSGSTDATFRLQTNASPFIFTNFAPFRTFYNGKLAISVNNNTILPAWDLNRHYYSPETQQTAAFGAASPIDQNRGAEDGFYACEPNIVLVGSKNYQINVQLPAGFSAVDANSRLVLLFRGVLAQNSTVVS